MELDLENFILTKGEKFKMSDLKSVEKARFYLGEGDYQAALANITQALLISPKKFECLKVFGNCLGQMGHVRGMLSVTETNLVHNPHLLPAYLLHVEALIKNHLRERAITVLLDATIRFKDNNTDLQIISEVFWELSENKFSVLLDYKMVQNGFLKEEALLKVIFRLMKAKKLSPIIDQLICLGGLNDTSPTSQLSIAEGLLHLRSPKNAIEILDKIDVHLVDVYQRNISCLLKAQAYLLIGDAISAQRELGLVLFEKLNSDDVKGEYYYLNANSCRLLGRLHDAEHFFNSAIRYVDLSVNGKLEYISTLKELKKFTLASKYLQKTNIENNQECLLRGDLFEKSSFAQLNKPKFYIDSSHDYYFKSPNTDVFDHFEQSVEERLVIVKNLISKQGLTENEKLSHISNLGKSYAVYGDWEKAFQCWEFSCVEIRKKLKFNVNLFCDRFFSSHTPSLAVPNPDPELTSGDDIVFLFGLPETGINKITQIFSFNHSARILSESESASLILNDFLNNLTINIQNFADSETILKEFLEVQNRLQQFFTKKMAHKTIIIDNIGWDLSAVMILRTIFPKATFCTSNRDMRETRVSLFSNIYPRGNLYSYSLFELDKVLMAYQRSYNYLKSILSSCLVVINYNDINADGICLIKKKRLFAKDKSGSKHSEKISWLLSNELDLRSSVSKDNFWDSFDWNSLNGCKLVEPQQELEVSYFSNHV